MGFLLSQLVRLKHLKNFFEDYEFFFVLNFWGKKLRLFVAKEQWRRIIGWLVESTWRVYSNEKRWRNFWSLCNKSCRRKFVRGKISLKNIYKDSFLIFPYRYIVTFSLSLLSSTPTFNSKNYSSDYHLLTRLLHRCHVPLRTFSAVVL
mgnify:CR=1 FL=1